MAPNDTNSPSVDRVAVKVPPFLPQDPELWFLLLESGFEASGITQESTKFGYAVGALDAKYAVEIRDVLLKPKSERTYELLKRELIKRMGPSKEENTRRLLENGPLGDRKPTQFLRHLRVLAGTEFPEEVLQTLWMRRLPTHMQALLAAHKDLTLDKRAEIADSVAEAYGNLGKIAETTISPATPSSTQEQSRIDGVERTLAAVLQKFAAIEISQISQPQNRSPSDSRPETSSRSRSRSGSRHRTKGDSGICYYHWRFGDTSRRCDKPCRYSSLPAGNAEGSR